MAEPELSGTALPDDRDDLRQIKGIGQSIAQALHEVGILRYADLAGCTAETLAARLHSRVPHLAAQRIVRDRWIEQARELARLAAQQAEAEDDPEPQAAFALAPEAGDPPGGVEDDPPPPADPSPNSPRVTWKELADFFVSYGESIQPGGETQLKTRVNYSQTGKDTEFSGIATDELIQWMLEQANLRPTPQAQERAEEALAQAHGSPDAASASPAFAAGEAVESGPQPEISDLWVSWVGASERKVRVQAKVDFPGLDAALTAAYPTAFALDVLMVNTESNAMSFYDTPRVPLDPEALPFHFVFEFPVPPPASYRMYLVARMKHPSKVFVVAEGPLVRVEG